MAHPINNPAHNPAAFFALRDTHLAEQRHNHDARESRIDTEAKPSFKPLANLKTTPSVRTSASSKTLSKRLPSSRKKEKKNDTSSLAHKLIEEMAADGDKEDLGDERRDPLELLLMYSAAMELLDGKEVKSTDDDAETKKANQAMLNKLSPEKKSEIRGRLDKLTAKVEKEGGEELAVARQTAADVQSFFDDFAKTGALTPDTMEALRPFFTSPGANGEQQAFSAHTISIVMYNCFHAQLDQGMNNLQKIVSSAMGGGSILNGAGSSGSILNGGGIFGGGSILNGTGIMGSGSILNGTGVMGSGSILNGGMARSERHAPRVCMTMADVRAVNQWCSSYRIAHDLWTDLSVAMKQPPRSDAGKHSTVLLEVPQFATSDGSKLLEHANKALAAAMKSPNKAVGQLAVQLSAVCKAYLKAVESLPMTWWTPESYPARLNLIDSLRAPIRGQDKGDTRMKKEADNLEQGLRSDLEAMPKAPL